MNAAALLAQYERIADAPDAVERLRQFILDLAVRGKLVQSDPHDEPASMLVARLHDAVKQAAAAGDFREPSSFIEIDRASLPFDVPPHWEWARLIEVAKPSYGFAFASAQFSSTQRGMPLIRIRDISGTDTEAYFDGDFDAAYVVRVGDYLVGMDGDFNLRRWRGKDALLNQRVMRINGWRCGIEPEFIRLPLQSILYALHSKTSQTTVKHLSAKQVNGIEVPIPPLAEQHRIVAKVDELMALCDRLEAARMQREATRDRLVAASLARLNTPDPEAFQADARFAIGTALPALTTRPDQIKQLRQTILNLAVRGRLVAQLPDDGTGAETLISIRSARSTSVPERRSKANGDEVALVDDQEIYLDIPSSWAWARIKELGITQTGTSPSSANEELFGTFIPFIKPSDLDGPEIDYSGPGLSEIGISHSRLAPSGSVLMVCIGATLGKVNTTTKPVCFNQQINSLSPFLDGMTKYLALALRATGFQSLAWSRAGTGTLPIISKGKWEVLPVPIPPLREQHRIVAKVDELMALCNRLEAGLTRSENTRSRLLNALLHEALAPRALAA